jgi:hypothetical protein
MQFSCIFHAKNDAIISCTVAVSTIVSSDQLNNGHSVGGSRAGFGHGAQRKWPVAVPDRCNHAGNSMPRPLDRLGVSETESERHIVWDISTAAASRLVADALYATLV